MGGTVLENASGRKLFAISIVFVVAWATCFLIGQIGRYPIRADWSSNNHGVCETSHLNNSEWVLPDTCQPDFRRGYHYNSYGVSDQDFWNNTTSIVYSFKLYSLSKWQLNYNVRLRSIYALLKKKNQNQDAEYEFEYKLGYIAPEDFEDWMNEGEKNASYWRLMAESNVNKSLSCRITYSPYEKRHSYYCGDLDVLTLEKPFYNRYLLNIKISTTQRNQSLKLFQNLDVTGTNQSREYSQLWWSLKTVFLILLCIAYNLYSKRRQEQSNETRLMRKIILILTIAVSLYNIPLEWFSVFFDMPWMPLLDQLRKNIVYYWLMAFWMILTGEQLRESGKETSLSSYWKFLTLLAIGSILVFTPDLVEHGYHLMNPFYTLWSTELAIKLELAYVILASVLGFIYCFVLSWRIWKVIKYRMGFRYSSPAVVNLDLEPGNSADSDERYQCCSMFNGLIEISFNSKPNVGPFTPLFNRYTGLMVITFLGAWLTLCEFIVRRVAEDSWKWGGSSGAYMEVGEFYAGVYGFWNLYVISLMILYSPLKQEGSVHSEMTNCESDDDQAKLCEDEHATA